MEWSEILMTLATTGSINFLIDWYFLLKSTPDHYFKYIDGPESESWL